MSAPAVPGRRPLDLTAYLGHQRWFAGKGRAWQVTGTATVGRRSRPTCASTPSPSRTTTATPRPTSSRSSPTTTPQEHLAHAFVGEETGADGGRRHLYDALHDKDATVHWFERHRRRPHRAPAWRSTATRRSTELPDRRPVDRRRRRAEQHLGHLRRHRDPQGLPQGLAGGQPRHRGALGARRGGQHPHRGTARLARGHAGPTPTGERVDREPGDGPDLPQGRHRGLGARAHQRARPLRRGRPARRRGRRRLRRRGAAARRGDRRGARSRWPTALPTGTLEGKELAALADGMRTRLDRAAAEVAELTPYVEALRAAFDDLAALADAGRRCSACTATSTSAR